MLEWDERMYGTAARGLIKFKCRPCGEGLVAAFQCGLTITLLHVHQQHCAVGLQTAVDEPQFMASSRHTVPSHNTCVSPVRACRIVLHCYGIAMDCL